MYKPLKQVLEFHKSFNIFIQESIDLIPEDVCNLRISLIQEEVKEVHNAMKGEPIESIAKELADLIYVTYGTVLAYGLQDRFEDIFDEVHRSNMSKLGKDGKVILRDDGKVLKSGQYSPADISMILNKE